MLTQAYSHHPVKDGHSHSAITRARISAALMGHIESKETRERKSIAHLGMKNPFFGKSLPQHILDAAAIKAGTVVYVYDVATFTLVNNIPFRSLRATANRMPISDSTLPTKLNTSKPFKGYYYFTNPQTIQPS